ncbi:MULTISPECIES: class I SAM-dependent methyltransferase [Streptomyces]|uniref:class I SAM-dependent methyltransferase n=1 Tax=Streptomyces TaxID=1883 RepID=UPI00367AF9D0
MARVYDDVRLAGAYRSGNAMPEESLAAWVRLIGSFAGGPSPRIIEVGSGTGMFCTAMARLLEPAVVLGVDASLPMLEEARRFGAPPAVRYVAGVADAVPVRDGVFDLALLSRVIHHLPDRTGAARELARVLRPGGVVVVRTTFRERLDALVYDYWPGLRELDEGRFPSEAEVVGDFTGAGFGVRSVLSFAQPVTGSLRAYHARMVARPQSKFTQLSDGEFLEGLERLGQDAAAEPVDRPAAVRERYDVVVLEALSG